MPDKIYLRRGNRADLPTLAAGEPGFALDTKEFFIGQSSGNVRLFIDSKVHAVTGYEKLASGRIEQWGLVNVTVSGGFIAFPIAFPTTIFNVVISNAQGTGVVVSASNAIVTGFNVFAGAVPTFVYYRALGI